MAHHCNWIQRSGQTLEDFYRSTPDYINNHHLDDDFRLTLAKLKLTSPTVNSGCILHEYSHPSSSSISDFNYEHSHNCPSSCLFGDVTSCHHCECILCTRPHSVHDCPTTTYRHGEKRAYSSVRTSTPKPKDTLKTSINQFATCPPDISSLNTSSDETKRSSHNLETLRKSFSLTDVLKPALSKQPDLNKKDAGTAPDPLPKAQPPEKAGVGHLSARELKKETRKIRADNSKVPFSIFQLDKKCLQKSILSTPAYPAARPNHAAKLRIEVSQKKLQDLQKDSEKIPLQSNDWGVKKTPGWKSLSLSIPHKEMLMLRLATRKAEQALQQREHALNMEMMRQRVKSSPLLLERSANSYMKTQVHRCECKKNCKPSTLRKKQLKRH